MMDRTVEFRPAWDKRSEDPKKNYGIHGVEIRFLLKGELGATQFLLYTNWMLPHLRPKWDEMEKALFLLPLPADLGYHSPKAIYKGQSHLDKCDVLGEDGCYYDGSGLAAERVFERLVEEGDTAVWSELEHYYGETFGELR